MQTPIRTVPLPVKAQKEPKLQRCFIDSISQSFDDQVNKYGTLTIETECDQAFLGSQLWGSLQAGVTGGRKKITKFRWDCLHTQRFYAVLLPCLSQEGQSILIDKRVKGTEKRIVEEGCACISRTVKHSNQQKGLVVLSLCLVAAGFAMSN